jgi:predicted GNAT family acetyltransferase
MRFVSKVVAKIISERAKNNPTEADAGKKGDWEKEGYIVKHIESIGTYHRFGAFLKGKMIGELAVESEGKHLFVEGTQIDATHRRKGLATALYELAEKNLKKKILNMDYKSDDSKKFWKQPGRKFGTKPLV